jgi:hypothetical protein
MNKFEEEQDSIEKQYLKDIMVHRSLNQGLR